MLAATKAVVWGIGAIMVALYSLLRVDGNFGTRIREFKAAWRCSQSTPQAKLRKQHTVTQCASSGVGWRPFILQELLSMT